jgi:hypothetical protein
LASAVVIVRPLSAAPRSRRDHEPSNIEQILGSLKTRVPVSKRGRFWESVVTAEGRKKCSEFLKYALPPGRVAAEALNAFELSDYPAHPLEPIQTRLSSGVPLLL